MSDRPLDVELLAEAIRIALWPKWQPGDGRRDWFWHKDAQAIAAEYARLAAPTEPEEDPPAKCIRCGGFQFVDRPHTEVGCPDPTDDRERRW